MRKSLIVLLAIFSLTLITGCGKSNSGTLKCTKTETDEDGYKITDTMEITYKNKKITNIKNTNVSEMDEDIIDMSLSFGEAFAESLNEIDGFNVKYSKEDDNKLKLTMEVDYSKLDKDALNELMKDEDSENEFYSEEDPDIDSFKEEYLEDYTCK